MHSEEAFRRRHLISGGCVVEALETHPTEAPQGSNRTPGVRTDAPWNMTPFPTFGAYTTTGAAISASTALSHPMHSSTVHCTEQHPSHAAMQKAPATYGNDGRLDTQQQRGNEQALPPYSMPSGSIYAADINYSVTDTVVVNQRQDTQQQIGYEQALPSCSTYSANIYQADINCSHAATGLLNRRLDNQQPTGNGQVLPPYPMFSGNIFAGESSNSGVGNTLVSQRQDTQQPRGEGDVLPSHSTFSGNIFAADPNNSGAGTTLVNQSFPGASGDASSELRGSMDSSAALVCDIYEFAFERADKLEKHTSDHVAGKRHQCSSCGSLWRTHFLLERHLRKHNNEKPFKCNVCHVSFIRKDSLTRHLKKCHQIEQPFKCNACGRSYFSKPFLQRHIESCEKMNANATPE